MVWLATADVAKRLLVSTRQVQHLVAQGKLASPARGVFDAQSVDRFLSPRGSTLRRSWSEPTAWGTVAILSGMPSSWLGQSQRPRLRAQLRTTTAEELVRRTRVRADVVRYAGRPAAVARLRTEIVDASHSAAMLGLAGTDGLDGYVCADHLSRLVTNFALTADETGRTTLHSTTFPISTVRELADTSAVLAALDLAEPLDVRERRAGLDGLTVALERLRDESADDPPCRRPGRLGSAVAERRRDRGRRPPPYELDARRRLGDADPRDPSRARRDRADE